MTPDRFSVAGLHAALADSLDLITSPAGLLGKSLLTRDPTGETLQVIDELRRRERPHSEQGVWSSPDGDRALLLAETSASGSDTDGQALALALIRQRLRCRRAGGRRPRVAAERTRRIRGPGARHHRARGQAAFDSSAAR